jgi:hypothetical protein
MATETVYGTIASSTVAVTAALTGNYGSVQVTNLGDPDTATAGTETQVFWVRADGTAAVKEADGCFPVMPGQSVTLNNGLAYWSQAYSVIPAGSLTGGTPGTPALVQPFGSSLAGGASNPGVSVSIILDTGTTSTPYSVASAD